MKTKLKLLSNASRALSATIFLSAVSSAAFAGSGEFGVGGSVGTAGVGIHAKAAFSDYVSVTGGFDYLKFGRDEVYDGINYEGDLKFSNFSGLVNFHPFKNGFNISGGAYIGDKTLDLTATPATNVQIGDVSFTPAEVGTLNGAASLKNLAPYAGIGYDGFMTASGNWSFNAKAGILFTGTPEISLVSTGGTLSNDPTFRAELTKEVNNLQRDIKDFKYYPVVSLGVTRKF